MDPKIAQLPYLVLQQVFTYLESPAAFVQCCRLFFTLGYDPHTRLKWIVGRSNDAWKEWKIDEFALQSSKDTAVINSLLKAEVCELASHSLDLPFDTYLLTLMFANTQYAIGNYLTHLPAHLQRFNSINVSNVNLKQHILRCIILGLKSTRMTEKSSVLSKYLDSEYFRELVFSNANKHDLQEFQSLVFEIAGENLTRAIKKFSFLSNAPDCRGDWAIHVAAKNNNVAAVNLILEIDGLEPLFKPNRHQYTALHIACELGNLEVGEILLEKIDGPSRINELLACCAYHPFHLAVKHPKMIQLLLRSNFSPYLNSRNPYCQTPLHCAANLPDCSESIKLLVDAGANADWADMFGILPLHTACSAGLISNAKLLLSAFPGAINHKSFAGTPLLHAIRSNHTEMCEFLLKNGADPTIGDGYIFSPLNNAVRIQNTEICGLLLECGADPNVDVNFEAGQEKSIHTAVRRGESLEVVETLLSYGADPCARDLVGATTLHLAVENKKSSFVRLLIEGVEEERATAVRSVAEKRMKCAENRNSRVISVKNILRAPEDYINAQCNENNTPLMCAARVNQSETRILEYLLQSGALTTLQNNNGETALDIARKSNHLSNINILSSHYHKTN
ncbi:hypothetical protein HK098_008207 [Nowakowskiella sp. JEL0407]|nr:hypothetical protein HK098_008207 [Nowakowskiella sp. JEL0407]